MIPFKLYVDENGKTYSYEDRTPLDPEAKENKRPVYIEEVPDVPNGSLVSAIVEKHKGKPTIIDFWGVHCIPCMKEISIKEKTKTDDVNYIYITCTANSPRDKWEETIKDISGYHYYISTDAFDSILENYQTRSIPFKLYYSADGKLENTVVGAEY
jgi:thiol-disulfide isomerase/thioredoxin